MVLHNHLLVNGFAKNPPKDKEKTIEWLTTLVYSIDMKILQGPFASYVQKKGSRGLTCIVMIDTSHISLHTWDEIVPAKLQFDLYTCSTLPVKKVLENLTTNFDLVDYDTLVIERGNGFNILPKERWHEIG
jgi:S-adenosylmethionine/arginine decarboxylase-like enzyme